MAGELKLTVFRAYRVVTTAGRVLEVMFRGTPAGSNRLWFTELDAPYSDVFLRRRHIVTASPIGANR